MNGSVGVAVDAPDGVFVKVEAATARGENRQCERAPATEWTGHAGLNAQGWLADTRPHATTALLWLSLGVASSFFNRSLIFISQRAAQIAISGRDGFLRIVRHVL